MNGDQSLISQGILANTSNFTLNILVKKAKGIKGLKGDNLTSFVRCQFADFDFTDSPQLTNQDYNHSYQLNLPPTESVIDQINNKSVIFTLFEVLPKEKTQVLATAELRLNQFLTYAKLETFQATISSPPDLQFSRKVVLNYLNPKLLQLTPPPKSAPGGAVAQVPAFESEDLTPELDVHCSISRLLIETEQIDNGNFLEVKLDDCFPLPEEWTLRDGSEKDLNTNIFTYTVNFMIPSQSTPERLISIPGGFLVNSEVLTTTEPLGNPIHPIYQNKPGPNTQSDQQPDQNDTDIQLNFINTNDLVPKSSTEQPQGAVANLTITKKISWNNSYIIWIPPDAVARLKEKILQKMFIELEFVRELQPRFAHVVDPHVNKYRGRALIDASSFLYPRVIGLKGRFPLDVYEIRPSTAELRVQQEATASVQIGGSNIETNTKKVGKSTKDETTNLYKTLGTTISVELVLETPLLNKKKLIPITKTVSDYIPSRVTPKHLLFEKRAKQADFEYQNEIKEIVLKLVVEYQGVLKNILNNENNGGIGNEQFSELVDGDEGVLGLMDLPFVPAGSLLEEQQRKKNFLFHLNKSGAYFYFKEKLKSAVVEVVRERFRKKSPFTSKEDLQVFMSQIYVYLTDQMHITINEMFTDANKISKDPTIGRTADLVTLKKLADGAEADGSIFIATTYHKERVAKYSDSLNTWFDYGSFCRRNGMNSTAQECFKEIISVDPNHINSLLAFGAIYSETEQFEKARVFFHTALDLTIKNASTTDPALATLTLTLMGLFYDIFGEEEESTKYFEKSKQYELNNHKTYHTENPDQQQQHESSFLKAARFLCSIHAGQLTERAITEDILSNGPNTTGYLILSNLAHLRGNHDAAFDHIQDALHLKQDDPNIWSSLGNLYYLLKKNAKAKTCYETVLTLCSKARDMSLVYIRLGNLYLISAGSSSSSKMWAGMAKSMFLQACGERPCSGSWLGAGRACIALDELKEAEDALSEANILNNRDAKVWAYLALLCLLRGRVYEGSQSIAQAFRLGVKDPEILKIVGIAFAEKQLSVPAVECFRVSLESLITAKEDLKTSKRSILIGKKIQQRQEKMQSDIKNMVIPKQIIKGGVLDEEKSEVLFDEGLESLGDVEEDREILREIEIVKGLLEKTLLNNSNDLVLGGENKGGSGEVGVLQKPSSIPTEKKVGFAL